MSIAATAAVPVDVRSLIASALLFAPAPSSRSRTDVYRSAPFVNSLAARSSARPRPDVSSRLAVTGCPPREVGQMTPPKAMFGSGRSALVTTRVGEAWFWSAVL